MMYFSKVDSMVADRMCTNIVLVVSIYCTSLILSLWFFHLLTCSTRTHRRTGISITLNGSELSALKDLAAAAGSSSSSGASANNNARLSNTAAPLLLLLQHPEILGI